MRYQGAGTFTRDRNCFNVSIGYTQVPDAITWISFDFYNPPGSYVKTEYEEYLYPKMAPHQRALLVPDASTSLHIGPKVTNGSASGWAIPDMVSRKLYNTISPHHQAMEFLHSFFFHALIIFPFPQVYARARVCVCVRLLFLIYDARFFLYVMLLAWPAHVL